MRELERETTDRQPSLPALCVVGTGSVGKAVASAGAAAGLQVELAGRDDAPSASAGAGIALLCVPDAAIEEACATLAEAVPTLRFVGHTSGATPLAALAPAAARGAHTFSIHPLQTFAGEEGSLDAVPAAISGDSDGAMSLARDLASVLGMRPFEVAEEDRAAYHAAASIASNFLVALEESASRLLADAGVEDARELLAPLVLRTASNWAERGPEALTGPIARGDEATVERHLEALTERAPELLPLYEVLAERTRDLAPSAEAVR